jgi:hypothetical protein
MRNPTMLCALLPAALACSGSDPSPTGLRPEFLTGCTTKPTISPGSSKFPVNAPAGSTGNTATFLVKNNCSTATVPWDFTASRTGQVSSVGAPSPGFEILAGGETKTVTVSFATASSAGSGTVVLTATSDGPPIATTSGTQSVTVTAGATGVPFGPYDLLDGSGAVRTPPLGFNLVFDNVDPKNIIQLIDSARTHHIKFVPAMTDGAHSNYLTDGKFDYGKWKARQDSFDTEPIETAMNLAVADGTVIFAELMDEPNHKEGPPPGVADWGGVMTHALLDSMARYTKNIFPTLKTGVVVRFDWKQDSVYRNVDVIVSQFGLQTETLAPLAYRDAAVAAARRQTVGLMFSLNILDGGNKIPGCPIPQTGGPGTGSSTCKMTSEQVRSFGDTLLSAPDACGLAMWTWDAAFMTNTANKSAFSTLANLAAAHPSKPCRRPS